MMVYSEDSKAGDRGGAKSKVKLVETAVFVPFTGSSVKNELQKRNDNLTAGLGILAVRFMERGEERVLDVIGQPLV